MTSSPSWPAVLGRLIQRESLTADTTAWAMTEIMSGNATPVQLAAFAVLLRAKGETADEIRGLVRVMLDRAMDVSVPQRAVDVVGTGGDQAHTVNISTMAALVTAGSGRTVVKHGNRAASSSCGTADVLEHLGVVIDLGADGVRQTVAEAGIGFCFAPVFHSGLRHAGAPRRELGVPTVFNFLGPLANPARPAVSAIGCADEAIAPVFAQVLADRGDTALVFRGRDGLDELTTATTSRVWIVAAGKVGEDELDPSRHGIASSAPGALRGGDAAFNAEAVRRTLAGEHGAIRDAVLLNAAAAIAAFDEQLDSIDSAIAHGLSIAAESIDSGSATALLDAWIASSRAAADAVAH